MILVAHAGADCLKDALMSWGDHVPVDILDGTKGMLQAYDEGWRRNLSPVLIYAHDDLILTQPNGMQAILAEFDDPEVGLVGLLGGVELGDPLLYRVPYVLQQLRRSEVVSNLEDAEVHGSRIEKAMDVAVIDGMLMAVRREILERIGGWPVDTEVGYINYDLYISCMARRLGYRTRVVPVKALHLGGRTVVALGKGGGPPDHHARAHDYIYREFADVLPFRAEQR